MEKISTYIYSFRKLRENGFTYVDKTAMLLPPRRHVGRHQVLHRAAEAVRQVASRLDAPYAEKVINPVSFGLCAEAGEFQNYWSRTLMERDDVAYCT